MRWHNSRYTEGYLSHAPSPSLTPLMGIALRAAAAVCLGTKNAAVLPLVSVSPRRFEDHGIGVLCLASPLGRRIVISVLTAGDDYVSGGGAPGGNFVPNYPPCCACYSCCSFEQRLAEGDPFSLPPRAADSEAIKTGAQQFPPYLWECRLEQGKSAF